jgi:5-methylcytosine-specific restriction endonuclease McrA
MSAYDLQYWHAESHRWGEGKIHIIDDENRQKTMCGRALASVPGKFSVETEATCKVCLDAVPKREQRRAWQEQWRQQQVEREEQRQRDNADWWARYNRYLNSPEWQAKRQKVLERDKHVCQACLSARATQVHHITYDHVFHEPLFDLRAICRPCHERLTRLDRERRS